MSTPPRSERFVSQKKDFLLINDEDDREAFLMRCLMSDRDLHNERKKYVNLREAMRHSAQYVTEEKIQLGERYKLTLEEVEVLVCFTLDKPAFYAEFNELCRRQKMKYPAFANLFLSACMKLAKPWSGPLYRGLRGVFKLPPTTKDPFYLAQFTSTTRSKKVADQFQSAGGTTMVFKNVVFGADISKFSVYPGEQEIIILPIEKLAKGATKKGSIEVQGQGVSPKIQKALKSVIGSAEKKDTGSYSLIYL